MGRLPTSSIAQARKLPRGGNSPPAPLVARAAKPTWPVPPEPRVSEDRQLPQLSRRAPLLRFGKAGPRGAFALCAEHVRFRPFSDIRDPDLVASKLTVEPAAGHAMEARQREIKNRRVAAGRFRRGARLQRSSSSPITRCRSPHPSRALPMAGQSLWAGKDERQAGTAAHRRKAFAVRFQRGLDPCSAEVVVVDSERAGDCLCGSAVQGDHMHEPAEIKSG